MSTSALQQAFEDARAALPGPPTGRDDHLEELADALGVTEAKLRAALGTVKPGARRAPRRARRALAKELGVSAAKVRAAFEQAPRPGPAGPGDREERKADLAKAIGVSEAKLEQAFRNLRKDFRAGRDERKDDRAADLAKALASPRPRSTRPSSSCARATRPSTRRCATRSPRRWPRASSSTRPR